eukprot:284818262_2
MQQGQRPNVVVPAAECIPESIVPIDPRPIALPLLDGAPWFGMFVLELQQLSAGVEAPQEMGLHSRALRQKLEGKCQRLHRIFVYASLRGDGTYLRCWGRQHPALKFGEAGVERYYKIEEKCYRMTAPSEHLRRKISTRRHSRNFLAGVTKKKKASENKVKDHKNQQKHAAHSASQEEAPDDIQEPFGTPWLDLKEMRHRSASALKLDEQTRVDVTSSRRWFLGMHKTSGQKKTKRICCGGMHWSSSCRLGRLLLCGHLLLHLLLHELLLLLKLLLLKKGVEAHDHVTGHIHWYETAHLRPDLRMSRREWSRLIHWMMAQCRGIERRSVRRVSRMARSARHLASSAAGCPFREHAGKDYTLPGSVLVTSVKYDGIGSGTLRKKHATHQPGFRQKRIRNAIRPVPFELGKLETVVIARTSRTNFPLASHRFYVIRQQCCRFVSCRVVPCHVDVFPWQWFCPKINPWLSVRATMTTSLQATPVTLVIILLGTHSLLAGYCSTTSEHIEISTGFVPPASSHDHLSFRFSYAFEHHTRGAYQGTASISCLAGASHLLGTLTL